MGRYAASRRRGGGPQPVAVPPTLVVTSVVFDGIDAMEITWDGQPMFLGGPLMNNFELDDGGGYLEYSTVITNGPTYVTVQVPTGAVGQPWRITGQPPQVVATIAVPDSGLTT